MVSYFKELNEQEGKPLLNIRTLNFDSTISPNYFKYILDSLHTSVIIGGSLDEAFSVQLANACFNASKKPYWF